MFFHKKTQDPLSFPGLSLVNLFLPDLYIYIYIYTVYIYIYLCTPTVVEIGSFCVYQSFFACFGIFYGIKAKKLFFHRFAPFFGNCNFGHVGLNSLRYTLYNINEEIVQLQSVEYY